MIRIFVKKEKGLIKQINFVGHANYASYGQDIVCAAVSATYYCSVNACYSLLDSSIEVREEDNVQVLSVVTDDLVIQKILNNMIFCLESLRQQYPKNIRIDKEEK